MGWLAASLVLSVALTIALNLAIRLFPGLGSRLAASLERPSPSRSRVRVVFPWRAMLLASLVLTIVVNLLIRLR